MQSIQKKIMKNQDDLYYTPNPYCLTECPNRDRCGGWKHQDWASYCAAVTSMNEKKKKSK